MPNDAPRPHADIPDHVSPEEWQARVDLAACYRLLARYGMADLTGTHTSLAVPASDNQHFLAHCLA
jgi:ribulose-5-phosphate 4-epimerase/fuculose-1-phosphate aldolase